MVNTTEITSTYDSLFTAMVAKYKAMWDANEIDPETYATLVGQASSQLITLSAELVQKQEQLDDSLLTSAKQRVQLDTQIIQTERQTAAIEKDIEVKERTTVVTENQSVKDIESKTIQDTLVQKNIVNAEKDIETKAQQILNLQEDNLVKKQQVLSAKTEVTLTERKIAQVEKDITTKERQMVVTEKQSTAQVSKVERDTALTERQITSLAVSDELKQEMTAADVANKTAQKVVTERQVSKLEVDITNAVKEDTRRERMNLKDLAVKDAQKTLTYRDAMLKEQQQLLLTNQTAYEAEKTQTLKDNTKANMLIRTIDGGVTEMGNYLYHLQYVPSALNQVIAEARADLIELSGADMTDYTAGVDEEVQYTIVGTDINSTVDHDSVTRTSDNRLLNLDDVVVKRVGERFKFTNNSTGEETVYVVVKYVGTGAAKDINLGGTTFEIATTDTSYILTVSGTEADASVAHTGVTRGYDGATLPIDSNYTFVIGDKVKFVDTDNSTTTIYVSKTAYEVTDISTLAFSTDTVNWEVE